MKRKLMYALFVLFILISLVFTNFSYAVKSLGIPETNINLKIKNLTSGSVVHMYLPLDMIIYNMQRFVENNLDTSYDLEKQKAEMIKKYLDNKDYMTYLNQINDNSFKVLYNEVEFRHYTICLGESELIGITTYNDIEYVDFIIKLNDSNQFKLVLKDYLTEYDASKVLFRIDEYNVITDVPLDISEFHRNAENSNLYECNKEIEFYSNEDFEAINKAVDIGYLVLKAILIIIIVSIFYLVRKDAKKKEAELKARRDFWRRKLDGEEVTEEKDDKKSKKKNKKTKKSK